MGDCSYTLFDTVLGRCGIAWDAHGLLATSFPDEDDDKTRVRLLRRAHNADNIESAPPTIEKAIGEICRLFLGHVPDFSDVKLNLEGLPGFDRDVINMTLQIPHGETKTYGDLARHLGDVAFSRRVGQALGRNPIPIIVPCHRVVGAGGAMTGFSAPGGTNSKYKLLKIEGALAPDLFD